MKREQGAGLSWKTIIGIVLIPIGLIGLCCGGLTIVAGIGRRVLTSEPSIHFGESPHQTIGHEKGNPKSDPTDAANDDLTHFVARYGPPDEDYSSANEHPRPLILTRKLTYRKERVRVFYVPFGTVAEPDISKWKLMGATDPLSGEAITPEEVVHRMVSRDHAGLGSGLRR